MRVEPEIQLSMEELERKKKKEEKIRFYLLLVSIPDLYHSKPNVSGFAEMAETRSVAAVRESVEESLSSKFVSLMEERMADLNQKLDSKIDSKMGELFEAMRLFQNSFLGSTSPRNRPFGSTDPAMGYVDTGQRQQLGGELEPRRGGKDLLWEKPPVVIKKEWSAESKPVGDTKAIENSGRKFLSQAEMSDRRAKGLCYFCDEKYTPNHYLKQKKTQLFSMEVDEEDVSSSKEDDSVQLQESEKVEIFVNAIAGIVGYRTMRVKGVCGKRNLYILIDSGSTHNFIDKNVVAKLGCSISSMGITKVTVADGSSIDVVAKVEDFSWTFQDIPFHTEAMVLPLGCCDMVLGIQWLETLGPVIWDFKKLTMEFRMGQRRVAAYESDDAVKQIIVELEVDPSAKKHFVWKDGLLRRKNKLVIANKPELKDKLLSWLHSSGLGGHFWKRCNCTKSEIFVLLEGHVQEYSAIRFYLLVVSIPDLYQYISAKREKSNKPESPSQPTQINLHRRIVQQRNKNNVPCTEVLYSANASVVGLAVNSKEDNCLPICVGLEF
ncbi:LOW QUALITY PROTEIN: hypothetical protein V2J09_016492 [Rumex salicifolius]